MLENKSELGFLLSTIMAMGIIPLLSILFLIISSYFIYDYGNKVRMFIAGSIFLLFFGSSLYVFMYNVVKVATAEYFEGGFPLGFSPDIIPWMDATYHFYINLIASCFVLCSIVVPFCFFVAPADKLLRRIGHVILGLIFLLIVNSFSNFVTDLQASH
jgi:hypothetical protein